MIKLSAITLFRTLAVVITLTQLNACKLDDLTDVADAIEGEVITPEVIESAEGARWVYLGGIVSFTKLFSSIATAVARFTDEVSIVSTMSPYPIDDRIGRSTSSVLPYISVPSLFSEAQKAKVQLEQGLQLVNAYYDASGNTMRAHLLGMIGMVHLILADNFCSGIPLSVSKWGGEFIPGTGYSTDSIYQRAVALFDQGLALNSDSLEVRTLLLVGKARALNALGLWREAAEVASSVMDADSAAITFFPLQPPTGPGVYIPTLISIGVIGGGTSLGIDSLNFIVKNQKGGNGLVWVTSDPMLQDMRIPIRTENAVFVNPWKPMFFFGNRSVHIAGGPEARLIEAESHLRAGQIPAFIDKINVVRRMYRSAGGAPLADTTDPGTLDGRIDLLFRERAYTLYISGRRLSDFRRLVRQYGREVQTIYPIGRTEGAEQTVYGENYVFVPETPAEGVEASNNPHYVECESYEP